MKHGLLAAVLIIIVISTQWSGCMAPETDLDAEKAVIEELVCNSIGWAKTKDTTLLYSCFAPDPNLFWYSPDSGGTIVGIESFRKLVEDVFMHEAFKAVDYSVSDMRINLSRSGDVAWYSCLLDDRNEWNGQPAEWLNTRWTGVLEKRDERWQIVQMHFSFASDS